MKFTLKTSSPLNRLSNAKWREIYEGRFHLKGLERKVEKAGKYEYPTFTYPEFGPARRYASIYGPLVVELAGRRWKIQIRTGDGSQGWPAWAEVDFELTEEPLTPFTEEVRDNESHLFGQPTFIQSEVFPHRGLECACLLATLETGWGDSGNENVFLALDTNGMPCGVFHEASCC